jgi:hypothetical protein
MQQNPYQEANIQSASQEIPLLLWNRKVHYLVHKRKSLAAILNHMHPVHTFPHYIPNIHSNIILLSTHSSSELSLPLYAYLTSHACYMPCPSHPPSLNHPNNIWWSVTFMKLLIMLRLWKDDDLIGEKTHIILLKYQKRTLITIL